MLLSVPVLFSCAIPAGTEKIDTETVGQSDDGRQVVAEQVYHYWIYPFSPEGFFYKGIWHYTYFYELNGQKRINLDCISGENTGHNLLKPFFKIYNKNKWLAFKISRLDWDNVDLQVYVFNTDCVVDILEVENAVRVSRCAEDWNNSFNYSISQSQTDGVISINTQNGLVVYDRSTNKFIPKRAQERME